MTELLLTEQTDQVPAQRRFQLPKKTSLAWPGLASLPVRLPRRRAQLGRTYVQGGDLTGAEESGYK